MEQRTHLHTIVIITAVLFIASKGDLWAGNLRGYVRDQNWYSQYQSNPYGVGYYEVGVNANGYGIGAVGGAGATDVYGYFPDVFSQPLMQSLPAGSYTVASWSVWWRPAYAFNVIVPATGSTAPVDLRLKGVMWGYPAFFDSNGYYEFGQTFVASGSISMIFLRDAAYVSGIVYTLTVHEDGPGGPRVGVSRRFAGDLDQRLIYGYGDMPTVAGKTYYIRIRTSSPSTRGVLYQMEPRPDLSDPMPSGCLWLGDGTQLTPYPDRDLGLIIMCNDDGLIANLFTRATPESWFSGATSVGQTFIARGAGVISASVWIPDAGSIYVLRIRENGPGGALVGTSKRARVARWADPELIATWAPGECPLVTGNQYYLEVLRDDGGASITAYKNDSNPYPFGQAYRDGAAYSGVDLAGLIMEEESSGSATNEVRITSGPTVTEANRGTDQLTIQWTTSVPSDSLVEYAVEQPPYTMSRYLPNLVTSHSVTITGLQSHTLYHYRVTSTRTNYRAAVSRDIVACTRATGSNLLVNPSFENGSGDHPRRALTGWNKAGSVDIAEVTNWFYGSTMKATNGAWLCQGAVNGSTSDGYIYQRVGNVTRGQEYTFSAWVMTAARENGTWKYDVWNAANPANGTPTRLVYMRLGIDPTGGTNADASTVRWTPRMYSHRRYTQVATSAAAQGTNITVFVSMKGEGVEWHLYAVDDCMLTVEDILPRFRDATTQANGAFQTTLISRANRTNAIEVSTDLINWTSLTNVLNKTGILPFTDAAAADPLRARFYRFRMP